MGSHPWRTDCCSRAPGAPRERQPLSVSLYSLRMRKSATYRSKLSSRASLPRAFSPVLNPANSGANGGAVQRSGARYARRKTVHHPNSALVGEYPPKNGILYRFCSILRRSIVPKRDPILSDLSARRACPALLADPPGGLNGEDIVGSGSEHAGQIAAELKIPWTLKICCSFPAKP